MRLVDVDYALKQLTIGEEEGGKNFETDCEHVRDFLKALPTIDAVPVVRCRECKHYKDLGTYYRLMDCTHRDGLANPYEDDFCSYGKQKD